MVERLTIGQVAKLVGVNVETVRYYHRLGLLDRPVKTEGRTRRYDGEAINRLRLIKGLQALGFRLAEIGGLLKIFPACSQPELNCFVKEKIAEIDSKMAGLAAQRNALTEVIDSCAWPENSVCPILSVLTRAGQPD